MTPQPKTTHRTNRRSLPRPWVAGDLGGLGRTWTLKRGKLEDPVRALRQRHQQLACRAEKFGVEEDGVTGAGRPVAQDA